LPRPTITLLFPISAWKILKKLDVLEADLRPTAEIAALREAILGLNRNNAENAETKESDNGAEANRTA